MTNEEIFSRSKDQLTGVDQQRWHLLQLANLERPCPACQSPVNLFAAAGIGINDYDFGVTQCEMVCPHCRAELLQVIPFIGFGSPWDWELKREWLQSQLEKARAWDELQKEES